MSHKWTTEEVEFFVTLMGELVVDGQRADVGQFKPNSFPKLASKMNEKFPGRNLTTNHCKIKVKRLEEKTQSAADMAACSEFGWNEENQCVMLDSQDVLEQYIKAHPKRFYVVSNYFSLFPRLEVLFGKDRTNGMYSLSSRDAEEFLDTTDCYVPIIEDTEMLSVPGDESDTCIQTEPATNSSMNKMHTTSNKKRIRGDAAIDMLVDCMETMVDKQGRHIQVLANSLCGVNEGVNVGLTLEGLGFGSANIVAIALNFSEHPQ